MKKRRESQIEAEKRYETKRLSVGCKLYEEEIAKLDSVRGDQGRTAFVKEAILKLIEERGG